MKDYLETTAAKTHTVQDIDNLMASLAPYNIEKAELLQIINERPNSIVELDSIIEEMDLRFDDDTQMIILKTIRHIIPLKPKLEEIDDV